MCRTLRTTESDPPTNWAEALLELGRAGCKQLRHGAGIEQVSRRFQSTPDTCQLALEFRNATDLLKLRAMVEAWSRERIVRELAEVAGHAAQARTSSEHSSRAAVRAYMSACSCQSDLNFVMAAIFSVAQLPRFPIYFLTGLIGGRSRHPWPKHTQVLIDLMTQCANGATKKETLP